MKTTTVKAFAKINLYLAVTGSAENGYHKVETVMQAVSLFDTVNVSLIPQTEDNTHITLTCSDPALPCDGTNLAWRAVSVFEKEQPLCGSIRMHIEKHIPIAGGLAGGSSDAAAVLLAMNRLAGEPLDRNALLRLGASLGADVPFCILANDGISAGLGVHFGEIMSPLPSMPACFFVIASAGASVSTPWAYKEMDTFPPDADGAYRSVADALTQKLPLSVLCARLYNGFERAVLPKRPLAAALREKLSASGAVCAMMSGSGPTIIGIFNDRDAAENAAAEIRTEDVCAWICESNP